MYERNFVLFVIGCLLFVSFTNNKEQTTKRQTAIPPLPRRKGLPAAFGEAKKEWYFRHNKIMDFFLVQNFLGNSPEAEKRLIGHMGDPRFRGVYFLLTTLLPLVVLPRWF